MTNGRQDRRDQRRPFEPAERAKRRDGRLDVRASHLALDAREIGGVGRTAIFGLQDREARGRNDLGEDAGNDMQGWQLEEFGLPLNLMLAVPCVMVVVAVFVCRLLPRRRRE